MTIHMREEAGVSVCGAEGETVTSTADVTCKRCKAIMRARAEALRLQALDTNSKVSSSIHEKLVKAFAESSIPSAAAPPQFTAAEWAATCKGGEPRCHECALCEWEREAERWSVLSIWSSPKERSARPAGAPKWPSLAAALASMVEFDLHGRAPPSAFGGILSCIERGYMEGGSSKGDDPLLARAGELVRVRKALALAYPEGSPWGLSSRECRGILFARTPGVFGKAVPPVAYDVMSAELGVSEGTLKAVVKRGRQVVTVELAARGLIPMPVPAAGLAESIETVRNGMVAHG